MKIAFYKTPSGRSPVEDFLDDLPEPAQSLGAVVIEMLVAGELESRPRHRDYLGNGLWELRWSWKRLQYRILYRVAHDTAWLLDAFIKKQQKTPSDRIQLADRRWNEIQNQIGGPGGD